MKQHVILILLLFTFNANAIESSLMTVSMGSGQGLIIQMGHAIDRSGHHVHDASEMSGKARSVGSDGTICDENAVCSVCMSHCTNIIVPEIDILSISLFGLISLKPDYAPSEISNNYILLLRPPRLS